MNEVLGGYSVAVDKKARESKFTVPGLWSY